MNKVENIEITKIKPYENNPRNNAEAVDSVVESIKNYGFLVPLVLDKNKVIITGHTRFLAAKKLGMKEIPCIVVSLNEADAKAYRIADNKAQDLSSWNYGLLGYEMDLLNGLGVDLLKTGFKEYEINNILGVLDEGRADKSGEIDLSAFDEETYEHYCPCCGFRW